MRSPFLWPYFFASFISILTKYVLRLDGRHLWNPSSFGVSAVLFLAPATVTLLSIQWGNNIWPMAVIWTLPHVGDTPSSKSKPLADEIAGKALLTGLVWWALAMALACWLLPRMDWAFAVAGAFVALLVMRRMLSRRLQGFTGDGLGATQQVCEIAFYLGLAIGIGNGL